MRQGVISCLFIKIKGVHDESLQTRCAAQHYQTTLANSLRGHGVVVAAASASGSSQVAEKKRPERQQMGSISQAAVGGQIG